MIEFHADGYLVGTTKLGDIIIYRKIEDIEEKPDLAKSRIYWKAHEKECHLISWNNTGDL